jgi:hypothetical protein
MLDKDDYMDERNIPLPTPEDYERPAGPNGARGNADAQAVRDALAKHCFWHC